MKRNHDEDPAGHQPSTHWTVLAALDGPEAESAWCAFVKRYGPFLESTIKRRLSRTDQLAEALGEFWGYLYLSRALCRADPGRRFRPYLAGIARNFVRAWRRKQGDAAVDPADTIPAADQAVDEHELQAWASNVLSLALDALTEESPNSAAALRGFYGIAPTGDGEQAVPQSASQLAASIRCSIENVYQMVSRGRRRLRALVEAELRAGCDPRTELDDEWRLLLRCIGAQHPGILTAD